MQIVSNGDNLHDMSTLFSLETICMKCQILFSGKVNCLHWHEMSNLFFWEKYEKYFNMMPAENFTQSAKWILLCTWHIYFTLLTTVGTATIITAFSRSFTVIINIAGMSWILITHNSLTKGRTSSIFRI